MLPEPSESYALRSGSTDSREWLRLSSDQANDSLRMEKETMFPEILPVYARKFMITDTYYETPPTSTLGYPGPDEALIDVDGPGLTHIPDDVIRELTNEHRSDFLKARAKEENWKGRWRTEEDDKARAQLKITYNG